MRWLNLEACDTQKTHGHKRYVGRKSREVDTPNFRAISASILCSRSGIKALPTFALLVSLHPSRSLPTYEIYSKLGYVLPFVLPQKRTRSLKFYHQNLWQMFGCLFVVFAFCTSRCRVQRCMHRNFRQDCSKYG